MSSDYSGSLRPSPFVGSEFPDEAFAEVRRILLERRHFDIGMYKDRCLKRRIASRVRALGFHEPQAYLQVLRSDEAEVDLLMTALTIHVSQFFRNPSMFATLERTLLPALIQQVRAEGRGAVRLWSAGCSSGEEPYTLAMLLHDQPGFTDWQIEIVGTDISQRVLQVARKGLYSSSSFRSTDSSYQRRFFTQLDGKFKIDDRIRRMVTISHLNLFDASRVAMLGVMDIVFCRNVIIYFDQMAKKKVIESFYQRLRPEGFLLLGHSESLMNLSTSFMLRHFTDDMVYQRPSLTRLPEVRP